LLSQAGSLRVRAFVDELHWLDAPAGTKQELDRYDQKATHIAVLDAEGRMAAYVRMWRRESQDFMLAKEFRNLFHPERLNGIEPHIAEVSRLAIDPAFRGTPVFYDLYYAMYRWSRSHGVRFWLCVTNERFLRQLSCVFNTQYSVHEKDHAMVSALIPVGQFWLWGVRMRVWQLFLAIMTPLRTVFAYLVTLLRI
jgi:N-acyl-L-homoserine lactone synthetase